MEIYLVGGAVRDKLLGIEVHDRDWVVVGATTEAMLAADYKQVGRQFPVFLHPESKEEYALARTETKTGPGYTGFKVHASPDVTLEQDLQRRDLTINAIAETPAGQIIDPFYGQADIETGTLRHVSPAFIEDPVRILRVARFAARYTPSTVGKYFTVAKETNALMTQMIQSGEADNLIPERTWQEMHKALQEAEPVRFFDILADCGGIHLVFNGDEHSLQRGREALGYACKLSDSPVIRFAALTSDLSSTQLKTLCADLKVPREYSELAKHVQSLLPTYANITQLPVPDILSLMKSVDAFRKPERYADYLIASEAAARALPNQGDKPHPQREYLLSTYRAAAAITAGDMTRVRLEGKALAEEIDVHRRAAISKIKRTYRWAYFNAQV